MKLDIILITYNQEQYIAQAVESILMQRVNDDVEVCVIVADDCSTDKTLEVIKSYKAKSTFPFIFLDSDHNLGISKNYQRAFAACHGDYVAVLEGDDWWSSPNHVEQHICFLDSHRECSMSMNKMTFVSQSSQEFRIQGWGWNDDVHYVDTKEQISAGNQLGNLSACVLRNACIQALPQSLFDIPIADWMLGVMLSQQGLLAILKESTSVYRTNENSQWASLTKRKQYKRLLFLAKLYDEYQNGKYHEYWKHFIAKTKKRYRCKLRDYLPPFIYQLLKTTYSSIIKKK